MKIYSLVLSLFLLKTVYARQLDSSYVRMYRDYVIINPWLGVPSYNLQVNASPDTNKFQDYVSNTKIMAGIDLTYRNLSVSIGIRTPLYANDHVMYGKSKAGSLSMRYTYKRWAFEGKYGNYSGFADATKFNPERKEVLPFRKDLGAQIASVGAIYTFRAHKFSYGAAFNYAYRQLRSSWSPLLIAHVYGAEFNAQNSVLDTNFSNSVRKIHTFNHSRNYGLGLGPGVSGTAVFHKRFFLTGMLCLGADFQVNKLTKNRNRIYSSNTSNPFVDFRFAMGYNTNRIFTAITFKSENLVFDMYKFDINHSYSIFTVEFGYRFNAPNWVRNTYNKLLVWNKKG